MSGQTYTTVVSPPTPEEQARDAARAVRADAIAAANRIVTALQGVATVIPGSMRRADMRSVQMSVRVDTSVVELDVRSTDDGRVQVSNRFLPRPGVSCEEEARRAARMIDALARAGLRPVRPGPGAAARRLDDEHGARRALR
jgi:hypothetical protein